MVLVLVLATTPVFSESSLGTCLLTDLQEVCLRTDSRRVHDGSHVDTTALVEEAPDKTWCEDAKCLRQQNERHPLVVADHRTALVYETFTWNCLYHRQVVSVADPADGVSVVDVAVGELCRTPAGDWLSDELFGADERCEADENDDRVLSVESIHVIVVHTKLYFAHCQRCFHQLFHRHCLLLLNTRRLFAFGYWVNLLI